MNRSAISVTSFPGATFLGTIVRAVASFVRALQHRHEIRHLAEFDDRMLKDIGLVRSDVEGALAESLFHDPSWVLVRSVGRHPRGEKAAPVKVRPVVPLVKPRLLGVQT
jgi:Uncharacterized conserved small protein